jgi:hypothetical protein
VGVDFFQDWASARYYWQGRPVYAPLHGAIGQYLGITPDNLTAQSVRINYFLNAHPPTSVVLVLPLARLDYPEATLIWNLLSLAAFLVSLGLIAHQLRIPVSRWAVFPLVALLLSNGPFRHQVSQGQFNFFLLLLLTGTWAADRSGRPWLAGVLLGMATVLKLFPAFLVLYFVLRRQWRAVVAAGATIIGLTLLSMAVLGVDAYRDYVRIVLPHVEALKTGWRNVSLTGTWAKLFDPTTPGPQLEPLLRSPVLARGMALLSALVLGGLLARKTWRASDRAETDACFGLFLTFTLLISAVTWHHYALLLLLPLTLAWTRLPRSTAVRALFLATFCAFYLAPEILADAALLADDPQRHLTAAEVLGCFSFPLYGMLGLFALGMRPAPQA